MAAHAAADGDPLDVLPAFVFQQAPHDEREFLREFLDDAMDQTRRLRVAFLQRLIELLFPDLVARPLAERVAAFLDQGLAGLVEDRRQRFLARAVTQEPAVVLKLDVVGKNVDAR